MSALPQTEELRELARRVIWFQTPEKALQDTPQLVAHALTYGTHEDARILRRYLSDSELREALDLAPPGVFDPRSWAYWNLMLDRYPAPPMPVREIPE